MTEIEEDFLEHFGVKGMRWGVRKQVSPAQQAKRNKKAGFYEKQAAKTQKAIDRVDHLKPRTGYQQRSAAQQRLALTNLKNRQLKDAERKRQGKLSSHQRKGLAIGLGVTGLFLASMMSKPISGISKGAHRASAEQLIEKERATQMYSLKRMFTEGHMDKTQFEQFSRSLNARYDRRVAEAVKNGINAAHGG